jgi:hypothetical protein
MPLLAQGQSSRAQEGESLVLPLARLGILSPGAAFVPPAMTRQVLALAHYLAKHQPRIAKDILTVKVRPADAQAEALLAMQVRAIRP